MRGFLKFIEYDAENDRGLVVQQLTFVLGVFVLKNYGPCLTIVVSKND